MIHHKLVLLLKIFHQSFYLFQYLLRHLQYWWIIMEIVKINEITGNNGKLHIYGWSVPPPGSISLWCLTPNSLPPHCFMSRRWYLSTRLPPLCLISPWSYLFNSLPPSGLLTTYSSQYNRRQALGLSTTIKKKWYRFIKRNYYCLRSSSKFS